MNYHLPVNQDVTPILGFAVKNKELVIPNKLYTKEQYPSLPYSMVKILSRDGRNIFVPMSKFEELSTMDF